MEREENKNASTHQNDDTDSDDVDEKVPRWRHRLNLQLTPILVQEIGVHDQAKLRAGEQQRGDETPYLGREGEELVGQKGDVVGINHAHVCRDGEEDGGCSDGSRISISEWLAEDEKKRGKRSLTVRLAGPTRRPP